MRIPFVPTDGCCRRCGRDVPSLDGEFLCEDCRSVHKPHFDRAASSVRFEGEARQMLLDFKFNAHLWLRDDFVDWLEGAARARFHVEQIDCILPIPISLPHWFVRGYNQSALLAKALGRRLQKPVLCHRLYRKGLPKRQSSLTEEARRENAKNSFRLLRSERLKGCTVLLVDDIMTTGSTLSEASRLLKTSGVSRVWCLSLARSLRV